jgi:hypothetical protein
MRACQHVIFGVFAVFAISAVAPTVDADLPEPKFRHQTIDDKIQIGYGVAVADVDGDKKPDILLADKRTFVWYRNPKWEKFVIAEDLTKRDNVCLAAQDLDGDGKCELAVGGDWAPEDRENSGAVFYMIPPEDRTQKWEAVKLHAEPTVHRMRWIPLLDGSWGLVVVPLHGRGKAGTAGSKILLYHKPADPRVEWRTELLDDSMHLTHGFHPGVGMVFVAGSEGVHGLAKKGREWTTLAKTSNACGEVRLGTFNWVPQLGDTSVIATIEPMHGNELVVYVKSVEAPNQLMRRVLTDQLLEGHALAFLHQGARDDLVVGWRGRGLGTSIGIALWTVRDPRGQQWREYVIDDGIACEDLSIADLDADGDLDIVASGRATKNVKIYWNETPK